MSENLDLLFMLITKVIQKFWWILSSFAYQMLRPNWPLYWALLACTELGFYFQNWLDSLWHRFNKVRVTFLKDVGNVLRCSIGLIWWLKPFKYKKPVWDYLSFVTWCVIQLEVTISRCVHCGHKGLDLISKITRVKCSVGNKVPKVSQENIPHATKLIAMAWNFDTRQGGSMPSCCLNQSLTLLSICCIRNQDSSDQTTFFKSSVVQFW